MTNRPKGVATPTEPDEGDAAIVYSDGGVEQSSVRWYPLDMSEKAVAERDRIEKASQTEAPRPKMTFEQFQATRRHTDDIGAAVNDARWKGEPPAKGNLYLDVLYIEEAVQAHWPKARGKWHLIIGREEWITDDLVALERRLYDFAVSEGYFE